MFTKSKRHLLGVWLGTVAVSLFVACSKETKTKPATSPVKRSWVLTSVEIKSETEGTTSFEDINKTSRALSIWDSIQFNDREQISTALKLSVNTKCWLENNQTAEKSLTVDLQTTHPIYTFLPPQFIFVQPKNQDDQACQFDLKVYDAAGFSQTSKIVRRGIVVSKKGNLALFRGEREISETTDKFVMVTKQELSNISVVRTNDDVVRFELLCEHSTYKPQPSNRVVVLSTFPVEKMDLEKRDDNENCRVIGLNGQDLITQFTAIFQIVKKPLQINVTQHLDSTPMSDMQTATFVAYEFLNLSNEPAIVAIPTGDNINLRLDFVSTSKDGHGDKFHFHHDSHMMGIEVQGPWFENDGSHVFEIAPNERRRVLLKSPFKSVRSMHKFIGVYATSNNHSDLTYQIYSQNSWGFQQVRQPNGQLPTIVGHWKPMGINDGMSTTPIAYPPPTKTDSDMGKRWEIHWMY